MKAITEKIHDLYQVLLNKDKKLEAERAEVAADRQSNKDAEKRNRERNKDLDVREEEVKKIEDVLAFEKELKERHATLEGKISAFKKEKDEFNNLKAKELKLIEDGKGENVRRAEKLARGEKELEKEKKTYKQEIYKEIVDKVAKGQPVDL